MKSTELNSDIVIVAIFDEVTNSTIAFTEIFDDCCYAATPTFYQDWQKVKRFFYQEKGLFLTPDTFLERRYIDSSADDPNDEYYMSDLALVTPQLDGSYRLNDRLRGCLSFDLIGLLAGSKLLENGGLEIAVTVAYYINRSRFRQFDLQSCILPQYVRIVTRQQYTRYLQELCHA